MNDSKRVASSAEVFMVLKKARVQTEKQLKTVASAANAAASLVNRGPTLETAQLNLDLFALDAAIDALKNLDAGGIETFEMAEAWTGAQLAREVVARWRNRPLS